LAWDGAADEPTRNVRLGEYAPHVNFGYPFTPREAEAHQPHSSTPTAFAPDEWETPLKDADQRQI
jgi:hypothetical protein